MMADIVKAAGIIIQGRKLLFVRAQGKQIFVAPGGKQHPGETLEQTLVRELDEELQIATRQHDLTPMGTFEAEAAGQPGRSVIMHCYFVERWQGELKPSAELAELMWIGADVPEGLELGSIFEHDVLPELVRRGLVV